MIPKAFITEWRDQAPWSQDAWVEQDLVISRALVEIYLLPAARYSEDIDLAMDAVLERVVAGLPGDGWWAAENPRGPRPGRTWQRPRGVIT